ncbi:MAG: CHAD domain-containing protein [Deltaproteobacteria bacterium]|nr:CHAD domain-containing protein [Deltaproteobacteria bacterium]
MLDDSIDNSEEAARPIVSATAPAPIRLEQLVHERVRRFMKLLPEVLNSEQVEAVHDLRVWSRRLQQVLMTMFPKVQENRADSVIRALRRARRGLSGWRDCDVLIALLDRRLRRLRDPDEQRAWGVVRAYLIKKREKEIRRARHGLAKRKLFTLMQRTQHLLMDRGGDAASDFKPAYAGFIATVSESIKAAYADWQAALAQAAESGSQTNAHYFRIKTKQLRYRIELARDLGNKELLLPLNWLKWLQDSLGQCHDRAELARIATEAIANTEFLLDAPRPASLLLKRLARELLFEQAKVKSLLAAAKDGGKLSQLEGWVARRLSDQAAKRYGFLDKG